MPLTTVDLTRILIYLKQARNFIDSGCVIAMKAGDQPLAEKLRERTTLLDGDIQHVDALRGSDGS